MRLGAALVALLAAAIAFSHLRSASPPPKFEQIADGGVYRLTQWWQPFPFIPFSYPVSVFLVNQRQNWMLIDAGVAGSSRQPFAAQLLAEVQAKIPAGDKLRGILLTHSHPDHIGALPLLLEAYPEAPVIVHENEKAFIIGDYHYTEPDSLRGRLLRWTGLAWDTPVKVPESRAKLLTEPMAGLDDFNVPDLIYVISFGHSPGHISLLHHPSRTVIAADGVSFVSPSLRRTTPEDANNSRVIRTIKLPFLPSFSLIAKPFIICPSPTCHSETAQKSFCLLADGMSYERLYASHDFAVANTGGGWTQDKMQEVAATVPECIRMAQLAEGGEEAGDGEQYGVDGEAGADEEEDDDDVEVEEGEEEDDDDPYEDA